MLPQLRLAQIGVVVLNISESSRSSFTDQVPPKPISWKQFFTKTREDKEGGQPKKGCPSKARPPHSGKPARKFDKRSYSVDVNRR